MVNSRQKGHKAELLVANMLTRHTQLPFEQTPGSGSGKIKGDLWLKHHINHYLIEVKFYKDDAISTKVFTNKSNNFVHNSNFFVSNSINWANKFFMLRLSLF